MKNRIGKLLCLLIVMFLFIGFGGEKVSAACTNCIKNEIQLGETQAPYKDVSFFKFVIDVNGVERWAYCFDAPLDPPGVGASVVNLGSGYIDPKISLRIINVLLAAGYPNYNLYYSDGTTKMSDNDAFFVTQAAVWYARYGENFQSRVYTRNFYKKMKDEMSGSVLNFSKYTAAFNKLVSAANNLSEYNGKTTNIKFSADSDMGMTERNIGGETVLVSNSTFSVSNASRYKVDVTGTDAYVTSIDGNENYGVSKEFESSDSFKVAIKVDGDDEVTVNFTITDLSQSFSYDLSLFQGFGFDGAQKLTLLNKTQKTPSTVSGHVKGKVEIHEFDVPFAKVDEGGNYVPGARLEIYTDDNDFVTSFDSIDGTVTKSLTKGNYYLKELIAPENYVYSDEEVHFSVGDAGELNDYNGDVVTLISMTNKDALFTIKKKDEADRPLKGATFLVYTSENYICGMTDDNGFLTKSSTLCDSSNYDEYKKGINKLSGSGIYSYKDFKPNQYLNIVEIGVPNGYELNDTTYYAWLDDAKYEGYIKNGVGDVRNITMNGNEVIEYSFHNMRKIKISKVSATNGAELPGAHLNILLRSNLNEYIDSWTSGNEPHEFVGIHKNVRYLLTEEYAPEGYVRFSSAVEFELIDDNGTIKTYNPNTGEEINSYSDMKLVLSNEPTKIQISKVDAVGGQELPGAELKICTEADYKRDGMSCTPSNKDWQWTSGKSPKYIEMMPIGAYYLVETIAPEGYVRQTNAKKFEVLEREAIFSVVMKNEPTKVTISKKDLTTGDEIGGAHIQIVNVSTNEIVDEWTSVEGKSHEIVALPFGEYKLIETLPAPDYQEGMIIEGDLVTEYLFTISQDNNDIKIDVYNQILTKVPSTGLSTINLFAIGGLMVFVGYEIIKMYGRKVTLK